MVNQQKIHEIGISKANCSTELKIGKKNLRVGKNGIIMAIASFSIVLASGFALAQEMFFPDLDILYPFDLWSVSHFLFCFSIMLIMSFFVESLAGSFVITTLITTLYEPFEYYMAHLISVNNSLTEVFINQVGDIIVNMAGIILAYFILKYYEHCGNLE